MSNAIASIDQHLLFPQAPANLTSRRRRWRHAAGLRVTACLRVLGRCRQDGFGIITYHRVSPDGKDDDAMLNVRPDRFRRQMKGLLDRGYQAWPLRQVVEFHRLALPIPRNVFTVVFDDGYHDMYRHAWPILCELQIPATVFLATAYLDTAVPFPFDNWSQRTSESRPLSSDECREMQAGGSIELGSHTHTHADFRGRAAEFKRDLTRSVDCLRERFGVRAPTFSFPYGFADDSLTAAAREVGVACALTAECELVTPGEEPFHWGRFGATHFDTPGSLAAKLDGWYSGCRWLWRRIRRRNVVDSQRQVAPGRRA